MAFPLATILTAAPGLISAAADVIRIIRDGKKKRQEQPPQQPQNEKIEELINLIEQQAKVIEDLAINNRNMVLAVRNNRIIAIVALLIGMLALIFSLVIRWW